MSNSPSAAELFRAIREKAHGGMLTAPDINLNARGDYDRTLLHEALAFENPEAAETLIAKGAPLDAADSKGQTPLHYASVYSMVDQTKSLLAGGANPNALDKAGNNPLWTAALLPKKNYDLIALLISHGADPKHKNGAGRSVLDFARQSENQKLWDICGGDADGF